MSVEAGVCIQAQDGAGLERLLCYCARPPFALELSTVANQCGWNPDVIERQIAHIEGNRVRAAYHRAHYLEDRVKLMQMQ